MNTIPPPIILANGAFPKSQELLDLLDQTTKIICCDGAANKLIESGREPNIIIGDLDSLEAHHKAKYHKILVEVNNQDTNDLTKAINWCLAHKIEDIIILGATGEREDHSIANISLLSQFHKKLNVRIHTEYGVFIPISKSTSFKSEIGQQVSIFSLNPEVKISSKGLKYPLQNKRLRSWWMGTLNEAISQTFEINFEEQASIIVYLLKPQIS